MYRERRQAYVVVCMLQFCFVVFSFIFNDLCVVRLHLRRGMSDRIEETHWRHITVRCYQNSSVILVFC
jgi:hypothetical protein